MIDDCVSPTLRDAFAAADAKEIKMTLQEQFGKEYYERPREPYSESENPEQWCEVLAWADDYIKWLESKFASDADLAKTLLAEYRQQRLVIATAVSPVLIGEGPREDAAAEAIRYADALLGAFSSIGIGE